MRRFSRRLERPKRATTALVDAEVLVEVDKERVVVRRFVARVAVVLLSRDGGLPVPPARP
jgi:hypothetical protein